MADFCKQCSIEILGEDTKDLINSGGRKLTAEEIKDATGWSVLCEGCGFIIVDDDGKCIYDGCEKHGKVNDN